MTIQEKALKLAEYDGYNKKCHISESIEELQKECILKYSSFDKLIELVNNVNKENNCEIIINRQFVILKEGESMLNNNYTREIYCNFYHYQNIDKIKEALIDCLLKYYELTNDGKPFGKVME